jgi:hypothetical protein
MKELTDRIREMFRSVPNPDNHYYALTILPGDSGRLEYSAFTHFTGYADASMRQELREASLVHADRILSAWQKIGEPGLVVNTADDFALFFQFGGHAVVEQELAEAVVSEWLAATPMVRSGEWGFASPECLPQSAMQRAPTPKLRMTVIKRDQFKCRVCGRSPSDHVDVELHVHHIRPWGVGGVTEERNLITLCHTCHNGLDPHFEHRLYRLLPGANSDRAAVYSEKLRQYQASGAQLFGAPAS